MNYGHLKLAVVPGEFKYVLLDLAAKAECLGLLTRVEGPICVFCGPNELSAILPAAYEIPSIRSETGWSCIRIVGELPFGSAQGLIATISSSLFAAKIGICVVSTFLTDWFFVRSSSLPACITRLKADGWTFVE